LADHELANPRIDRSKAKTMVEPECARLEPFAVARSELIRLDDEALDGEELRVGPQDRRHDERRLTAAERREHVDPDAAGAEKRPAAAIGDRDRILEQHVADVRIERRTPLGVRRVERDREAAPEL